MRFEIYLNETFVRIASYASLKRAISGVEPKIKKKKIK